MPQLKFIPETLPQLNVFWPVSVIIFENNFLEMALGVLCEGNQRRGEKQHKVLGENKALIQIFVSEETKTGLDYMVKDATNFPRVCRVVKLRPKLKTRLAEVECGDSGSFCI